MDNTTQFKIGYNPAICDGFDWRIKGIANLETGLKKIPGNDKTFDWEPGSIIKVTEMFIFDKKIISLTQPEMTALYLNFANKCYMKAQEIILKIEKDNLGDYTLEEKGFDLLENIIASIMFSVGALEVFFNQHLIGQDPNVVLITSTDKESKKQEFKKDDLEWLSVENKILFALPLFYKIKQDRVIHIESKLKQLNKLRNRLVHLKSIDLKNEPDIKKQSTLWKQLFEQTKKNPATIAKEIIKFFFDESKMEYPRWLRLTFIK